LAAARGEACSFDRPARLPTPRRSMPTATSRIVRASLASVVVPLALLASAAPRLRAQTATPDSRRCDPINPDRPGIADGSHVVGAGRVQLETGYAQERHVAEGTMSRVSSVPALLRIGLGSRVEARLESNTFTRERVTSPPSAVSTSTGLSSLFLGAKVVLFESPGDSALSVATIVRVAPPSGTDEFRTGHTTGDVRIVADWQFTPTLSLNPNVGWAEYEGSDGSRFSAALGFLTLSWQPTPRWNPFVDLAYQSREDAGGTWAMLVDAGASYLLGCDLALDLSAGQNLHGFSAPKPFVAAGISVRADLLHRSFHPFGHLHGD
ncbi:MAG TPA: transporter, partial [Gemmatimonadaceae bacterium]